MKSGKEPRIRKPLSKPPHLWGRIRRFNEEDHASLDLLTQFDDFHIRLFDGLHRRPKSIGLILALGSVLPTLIAFRLRSFQLGLIRLRPGIID